MKPGFIYTVRLLLKFARKRSMGRAVRQKQLLNHRTGNNTNALQTFGYIAMCFFMLMIHGMAANCVHLAVESAQRYSAENEGQVVVSSYFYHLIREYHEAEVEPERAHARTRLEDRLEREAERRADRYGGDSEQHQRLLLSALDEKPLSAFVRRDDVQPGLKELNTSNPFVSVMGSVVLLWWLMMLTFQGEGLEMDLQRRRHPMWEWLLSHPVPPGAVFLAEMLAPFAANPVYLSAPIFFGILFGMVHGPLLGILAVFVVGLPVAVAAAALGKAFETCIMLRCEPRSRGAIIGFMGWLGYAALISFLFGMQAMPRIVNVLGNWLYPFAQHVPSSLLGWMLGALPNGSYSFLLGAAVCWIGAFTMIAFGVGLSVWGTRKGLSGNNAATQPSARMKTGFGFGKDPLYRKELLWFIRDRSAIVQVFLIPITIAGVQLFNLRNVMDHTNDAWHTLAGAAVVFGTYFLWILGPRSLASEGTALWIAQTWPRGMEDLLKTKAKLWFILSSGIVLLALAATALRFPVAWWKLAMVGIGWLAFGRSMAEKSVTLVSAPSSSGEPEKIPVGRRMAAALGMLTFGIGILTRNWQLTCIGIVYSWMTAAAMWQNFRARLPYLFDPWSEKVPPPPTVMHAMIAISVLIEVGAVFGGIFALIAGDANQAVAQMIAYAIIAAIVMFITSMMMADRYLPPKAIWNWKDQHREGRGRYALALGGGALVGLLLGLFAHGYLFLAELIEPLRIMIQTSNEQLDSVDGLRTAYFVVAVFVAPFAEEFLFRGMLFRALDKEWGGWKALLGSSAFFAIYHPPMSWIPVGLLGLMSAVLFKKTGRLLPCVLLHMVYNVIVLAW